MLHTPGDRLRPAICTPAAESQQQNSGSSRRRCTAAVISGLVAGPDHDVESWGVVVVAAGSPAELVCAFEDDPEPASAFRLVCRRTASCLGTLRKGFEQARTAVADAISKASPPMRDEISNRIGSGRGREGIPRWWGSAWPPRNHRFDRRQ